MERRITNKDYASMTIEEMIERREGLLQEIDQIIEKDRVVLESITGKDAEQS